MQQALVKAFQKSATSPTAISRMVTYLFQDRSPGHTGAVLAPFLDLGFIYRTFSEVDGSIEAFPICLSAETALIELWKEAGLPPRLNLQECIAESNGADFKAIVFHTLLLKYSNEFRMLPCARLGYFGGVENLAVKIDVVHTSSLSTNASITVAGEINTLHAVAKRKKITILYKCPKGTESVDFCVLSPKGVIVIQVSLKSLTAHKPPNHFFLGALVLTPPNVLQEIMIGDTFM